MIVPRSQLLVVMGVLFSCAGCQVQMPRSGFLKDYSHLEPVSQDHRGWDYIDPSGEDRGRFDIHIWLYRNEDVDLSTYDHIMVDDGEVLMDRVDKRVRPEEVTAFMAFFKDSLIETLGDRYPVVEEPAPGVLRFRSALTRLEPAYYYQTPDRDNHPLKRWANSLPGGATVELEMLDAVTGEQLCAIIMQGNGSAFNSMREDDAWEDPRRGVRRLIEFVRIRLDELHDEKQDSANAGS